MSVFFRNVLKDWRLWIFPVAFVFLVVVARTGATPYYMLNYDPDYAYLFNSLSILGGLAPLHIDHPGATVQILGTAIIWFLTMIDGSEKTIYAAVIDNPEAFLAAISNVLIGLFAFSVYLSGRAFRSVTGRGDLSLLTQASLLASPILVSSLGRVSPEPIVLVISACSAILLLRVLRSEGMSIGHVRVAGLLVGAGMATKVTFMPVALIFLFLLPGRVALFRYVLFGVVGFLVCTSPWLLDAKNFYYFFRWIGKLFLGAGIYGGGAATVIDAGQFLPNLADVIRSEMIYALMVLSAFLLVAGTAWWEKASGVDDRQRMLRRRVLYGLLLSHIVAFLVVAKHPQSTRYLVPTMGLGGFTLALAWWNIEPLLRGAKARVANRFALAALLLLGLGAAWNIGNSLRLQTRSKAQFEAQLVNRNHEILAKHQGCAQIHRDASTREFAIFMGIQWSNMPADIADGVDAMPIFQGRFFYDPGRGKYYFPSARPIESTALRSASSCQILLGPLSELRAPAL